MKSLQTLFITDITHIFCATYAEPIEQQMRDRRWFGICFAKKGSVIYHHNGKKYLCDKNHAVFIPKGTSYTYECASEGVFPIINFQATDSFSCNQFFEIELTDPLYYGKAMEVMEKLFSVKDVIGCAELLSLFYHLIAQLQKEKSQSQPPWVKQVLEYMDAHFCNPSICNESLAKYFNLSVSHFRNLFKKYYGISPMNYIQRRRIEEAKRLIQYTEFSITAVSEHCGFSNLYSFSRAFKEKTGLSPTEFAKKHKTIGML